MHENVNGHNVSAIHVEGKREGDIMQNARHTKPNFIQ